MNKIIVYYRHAPSEPAASEAALAEQRATVAAYVREHDAAVVAEFIEEASGHTGPVFDAACRACATLGAELVVASEQPVGSGQPLRWMYFPVTMDDDLSKPSLMLEPIEPIVLGELLSPCAAESG